MLDVIVRRLGVVLPDPSYAGCGDFELSYLGLTPGIDCALALNKSSVLMVSPHTRQSQHQARLIRYRWAEHGGLAPILDLYTIRPI